MPVEELRRSPMMAHLLDTLAQGHRIGHYGRLVFAIVGRYFLTEDELIACLANDPGLTVEEARALYLQVVTHDYSPPTREKVLAWQRHQAFPICPTPEDPSACNVYRELEFPEGVYAHIEEFYEDKARSRK